MMQKIKVGLPLGIFLMAVILCWEGLKLHPNEIPSSLINKPVPIFQAPSLFHPTKMLTNDLFKGHVSLLNVFATWCVSCVTEHELLMQLYQSTFDFRIYGLSYKDHRNTVQRWLQKRGDPYRAVINDETGNIGIDFGVYGTPETFVIDQQGIIRDKIIGPVDESIFQKRLLPLIQQLRST